MVAVLTKVVVPETCRLPVMIRSVVDTDVLFAMNAVPTWNVVAFMVVALIVTASIFVAITLPVRLPLIVVATTLPVRLPLIVVATTLPVKLPDIVTAATLPVRLPVMVVAATLPVRLPEIVVATTLPRNALLLTVEFTEELPMTREVLLRTELPAVVPILVSAEVY